ncbi:MAG: DUF2192 domain-containing protein [Candidatus Nezhaarchaeota archaeon]|nr:DUF2192 domain-containing protein [Candidatus Nezhaarchaeota archaeon]MCX8141469.1 DUF2192 domain-containing protein [Candidatus Nezhaarchaeota archaeon]MDW8049735.1 DUF2192 domain-containing protein [Nitrososphaerota archaeon]
MNRAYRLHVDACNEVLSLILAGSITKRMEVIEKLSEAYKKRGIGPIRGWSSKNLYDKEMATVYVVGKQGLGLDFNETHALNEVFSAERSYERTYNKVIEGVRPSEAIQSICGSVDKNNIFRVLRIALTAVVLGFEPEEKLMRLYWTMAEEFKQYERSFFTFMRFYVALRVAEKIALGEIKNRREKEALKLAICVRNNVRRMAPPDELISLILKEVFGVPKHIINRILGVAKS